MKAAVYTKTKAGKVLEILDVEAPVPGDNEVLIRVRAASVNPLDWRMKARRPGMDVAGEVVAIGKNITRFGPMDAVFGTCKGAFAEYACLADSDLISKPAHLTFEQAASLPIAGLTALQGLRDKGRVKAGHKVLINGASGGVGTFAVQIARVLGAEVTGVCSSKNVEMVRSLGAATVIDYTREDFTSSGCKYDVVLDNVGNRTLSSLKRVLMPQGHCVMVGVPKAFPAIAWRLIRANLWSQFSPQKLIFFFAKVKVEDLATLCELTETGKLLTMIDKRYGLNQAANAIAYVEEGHAPAKVIINVE